MGGRPLRPAPVEVPVNEASRWRLQFARYVAEAYAAETGVTAALIGGSAARGHADRWSDVEIGVFWDAPPTPAERRRVADRIVADGKRVFPFDPAQALWSEDYFVGRAGPERELTGLMVEVAGHTVEHFRRTLGAVVGAGDPDPLKQNLIAGVMDGLAIKNARLLDGWRAECSPYPDALARAVVLRYGQIDHFWRRWMWLERGNRLMFDQQMCDVRQRLLHVLLAVNRTYYSGFKWLPLLIGRMAIAPRDFGARFADAGGAEPESAAERLGELVEEVYDLVEAHVPGVPVDRLRSIFRWQRPQWGDEPPPFHPRLPERP